MLSSTQPGTITSTPQAGSREDRIVSEFRPEMQEEVRRELNRQQAYAMVQAQQRWSWMEDEMMPKLQMVKQKRPPFTDYRVNEIAQTWGWELIITEDQLVFVRRRTDDETEEIITRKYVCPLPAWDLSVDEYNRWMDTLGSDLKLQAMIMDGVSSETDHVVVPSPEPPGGHDEINRVMHEMLEQKREKEMLEQMRRTQDQLNHFYPSPAPIIYTPPDYKYQRLNPYYVSDHT